MKALHARNLLRLAGQELTQEKARLFSMLATMLVACLLLFCGLLTLSALIVVAAWTTPYRVYALSILVVLYLAGAALAWRRFESLERLGEKTLEKTRQELADTLQRFENGADYRNSDFPQSMTMQLLTQESGAVMFLVTELLPSLLRRFSNRRAKRRRARERDEQA